MPGYNRYKRSGDCVLCGTWRQSLHRDHIVPKFKGGSDEPSNWQFICANCHEDKTRLDLKGRKRPPRSKETKEKIRAAVSKPRNLSPEQRKSISERMSKLHTGNQYNVGKKNGPMMLSPEERARRAEHLRNVAKTINIGRKRPDVAERNRQRVTR